MSSLKIFDVAGSGMNAQMLRLNLTASNLANVDSVSSSIEQTYKSRQPVFAAQFRNAFDRLHSTTTEVKVLGVVESPEPLRMEYAPNHPMANDDGYIFKPNVDPVEELANMIAASRSYQNNIEVLNTAREMMMQTLKMGQ
ncbi:flagellar basal-body rod protein FlgC [Methylomarinovum tepidoasis]|uniref:Flagellar basal-body rod protein FlgC n=1 Tax=Methylomarinovum tepidoasis TaxID=2840183 RepID=A0AAU9CWX2_9GAMM|nr:flagellar basal body rod protein FlgC [Methylomarinovum sp. IN45]BCX88649.1 flagellar basal-body rod protein FlgC [Methylomarinovum sp. IN45]